MIPLSFPNIKQNYKGSTAMAKEIRLDTYMVGEKYTLTNHAPGFYTATDAKTSHNQHITVLADEYTIFSTSNGMINLTKRNESEGFWINPQTTKR